MAKRGDLAELPVSSVPAAFDRGRLYSPTLDLTCDALDDRYIYDYRPGDDFEPMPPAPRGGEEFAWWWRHTASEVVPDFLGLRTGDEITIHLVTRIGLGEVIETRRHGAIVRYPLPGGGSTSRTRAEMEVCCRNDAGHWY